MTYSWLKFSFVNQTQGDSFPLNSPLIYCIVENPNNTVTTLDIQVQPNKDTPNYWVTLKTIDIDGTANQVINSDTLADISGAVGPASVFRFVFADSITATLYFNAYRY